MFILDRGGVKSVMFNSLEMRRVCPSLAPILILQKHGPIIKHGLLKSQRGDTHIVQRETRHKWRSLTSRTHRLFAFSLFSLSVLKESESVSVSMCASISHILSHSSQGNDVEVTARWQPYTCEACVCVCLEVSVGLWFFSHHILFLSLFFVTVNEKDQTLVWVCELTDAASHVFLFFSPRCTCNTIRHPNISPLHRKLVKNVLFQD